jgi:hypothetical protein
MQAHKVLHKLLTNSCPMMHKTRREALEATVLGALIGQRLTVTSLGRSIPSQTSHKHTIKRADRLLSNVHLHQANHQIYRALAHQLIPLNSRPVILIDWSDMDEYKQHFLLRASLATAGRSITLYEEVHTLKTKEKLATHQVFVRQLQTILPSECTPILVTDAGFRTTWFKLVASLGWDWVGRVRNRHYMRWASGGRWFDAKRCYTHASSRPQYLGEGVLTLRHQVPCQFVLYQGKRQGRKHKNRLGEVARNADSRKKAKGQREPWLLATSLPDTSKLAKKVVVIYGLRMTIEEGFRDVKSHRFGLGLNYHRTTSVMRLQMLLLIAHLALLVLWLLGMATITKSAHYQFQANTVRHKRVLSVIFIGLQMVNDKQICLTNNEVNSAWEKLTLCAQNQLCLN